MRPWLVALVLCLAAAPGCGGTETPVQRPYPLTRVRSDRTYLRDDYGRYVVVHGINVSGGDKVPASFSEKGVPSYVGKPFPVATARQHFARLRDMGFNAIRLLVMWEGIQPEAQDKLDEAYLDYLREIVKAAAEYDIYVLPEMHQDVFSRFLAAKYNQEPKYGAPQSLENTLLALVKPYDDVVSGNGAPRWVVETCLPEKDLSSPNWGIPRVLSGLKAEDLGTIAKLYLKMTGGDAGQLPPSTEWISEFLRNLPANFPVNETTDMLPFSPWVVAHALSLDVARCYSCFFAGDVVFPKLRRDGKSVKEYVQEGFTRSWTALAERLKDLPNVIGYDIFNEPSGNYLVLAAVTAAARGGAVDSARSVLVQLLGPETGAELYDILLGFRLLPPDSSAETLRLWGLDQIDLVGALSLNHGFDEHHLRPFYERVGTEIQKIDPRAVIWIEGSINPGLLLGGVGIGLGGGIAGQFDLPMTRPVLPRSEQVVLEPHFYADIYPFPAFTHIPRSFTVEEVRHRDYQAGIERVKTLATYSLGNLPVVVGEFGVFFDFNGPEQARKEDYIISSHLLNNYYESFERTFESQMVWDYCPENDAYYGDLWNHEDLSIIDPDGKARSEIAWSRPHAKALAGKPISTYFNSDLHYYDPDKGKPIPRREFEVRYAAKETSAPSEVFIPPVQYPTGFYVWVSDGTCYYDHRTKTLYHYPDRDEPKTEHWVRIRPPLPNQENLGWRYFFNGDQVLVRQ